MTGIVIGWYANVPWEAVLAFTFLAFVVWRILLFFHRETSSIVVSYLMIISLGAFTIEYHTKLVPKNDVARCIVPGRIVQIEGVVSDPPRLTPYSLRWGLDVEALTYRNRRYDVSGSIVVTVRRKDADTTLLDSISYGRTMKLIGEVCLPSSGRNPGDFNLRRYYELNGIRAVFNAQRCDNAAISRIVDPTFIGKYVHPVRTWVSERLDRLIGGAEADFLKGLIIGERTHIPQEVKASFVNAGVMHILAVSGLHVAIVVMMLLISFRLLRVPENAAIILTMVFLVYYTFLTGAAASVARSVVMACVFLGAKLVERRSDMYNTLALSAIVILFVDARQLFQPGFQLSFAAVFSLVYLYPKLFGAFTAIFPDRLIARTVPNLILQALAVSLAAGIGTLPFSSLYFGKISLVSIIANIVVVPISNIVLALGMLSVLFSTFSWWLASIYAAATSFLTLWMVKAVTFFGSAPFAFIDAHFSIMSSVGFYAALGFLLALIRSKKRGRVLITALVVANCIVIWRIYAGFELPHLRVTFLDVGQGDAAFIEFPNGATMLVDGGPRTATIDAGERFILPFLKSQGITRLDAIVLTHPHSDHLGGIPSIFRNIAVGKVYDAGSIAPSTVYQEYLHGIDSLRLERETLRAGSMLPICTGVRVYVLHPTQAFVSTSEHENLNNQSVVLRIVYGRCSLFLTGDAEAEAEAAMLDRYGRFLRSGVLKVGHHGSTTSTTAPFFQDIHPSLSIISVGVKNKFRHPSPSIVKRLMEGGAMCLRTDELGAVVLEGDGETWRVVEWR